MQAGTNRRWWALGALVLPVLLISMDATVLGFAVPVLSEALEPSSAQLLWIVDIYSFVLAGLLITMGVLGDRIGRRRLLVWGAVGFTAASLLAAFSTSAAMLIGARALLGVAGSTLMPSTLSLIRNIFTDDRERQMAIAVWSTAFAVGTTIGPIVGGFLLEHFWWGSIFLVNVPVTLALMVLAPRLVDESRDPDPGRFDLVSAALSLFTMLPAIYAVKTLAEGGATAPILVSALLGVTAGVAFVRRQQKLADPMIDVALFGFAKFRMAVSGNLVACFGFAGSLFIITQYLQLVVGMSPLAAGLTLLPAAVVAAGAMIATPTASRRFGPFMIIAVGLGTAAIGFALLSQVEATGTTGLAIIAVTLINAGLGAAMTVSTDAILAAVPAEKAGSGAALSETACELGVALGTAVLGSIMAAVYRPRVGALAVPARALDTAQETLGAAVVAARDLPRDLAGTLLTGARAAFVDSVSVAGIVAAVLLALVALWAAVSARSRHRPTERSTGDQIIQP